MSAFADIGRQVIEACVTASLGPLYDQVDVPAVVTEYVERWGFVDLDEVSSEEYWRLVRSYAVPPES